MQRLKGKVAIITGAASGMGKAGAELFASEGAKVVATDIAYDDLVKVVQNIKSQNNIAIAIKHDVANEKDWQHVVNEAIDKFGQIDILVNNAGIFGREGSFSIDEMSLDVWNKYVAVNATGNFLGIKYVIPHMKEKSQGSIINISSINGIFGGNGVNYCSTKGANRMLARSAAIELAPFNIRVNSVHPGYIQTGMTEAIDENKEAQAAILKKIPLGRPGEAKDIANLMLFLGSEESKYITGSEIVIDGGWTATI